MLLVATLPNTGSVGFVSFVGFANGLLLAPPKPPAATPPNEPKTLDVVFDPKDPNVGGVLVALVLLVEELTVVELLLAGGLTAEEPNIGVAEAFDEAPPLPNEPKIFVEAGVLIVAAVEVAFAVVVEVDVEVLTPNNVLAVVVAFVLPVELLLPKLNPPKAGVALEFVAAGVVDAGEPKLNIGFTAAVVVADVEAVVAVVLLVLLKVVDVDKLLLVVDEPKTKPVFFVAVVEIVAGVLKAKLSKPFFSSATDVVGFVSVLVPKENPPVVEEVLDVPKPNDAAATVPGLSALLAALALTVVVGNVNFTLGVLAAVAEDNDGVDEVVAVVVVGFMPKTKPVDADETVDDSFTF